MKFLIMFWKTKSLKDMTPSEWESLCDRCGKCCVVKLEDFDTHEIYYTNFNDLLEIIKSLYNKFKKIIPGRDVNEFRLQFEKVANVRNKIMHCRPITENDKAIVELFYNELKQIKEILNLDLNHSLQDCIDIYSILHKFNNEINQHEKTFKKYTKECNIDEFNKAINLFWWHSTYFESYQKKIS